MNYEDLVERIYYMLIFYCRPEGIPTRVCLEAADAAAKKIVEFMKDPSASVGNGPTEEANDLTDKPAGHV